MSAPPKRQSSTPTSPRKRPCHSLSAIVTTTTAATANVSESGAAAVIDHITSLHEARSMAVKLAFEAWVKDLDKDFPSAPPLPPLSDPYLWNVFVNNVVTPRRPSKTSSKQDNRGTANNDEKTFILQDEWHIQELLGDKYLGELTVQLFEEYSLPHSILNMFHHVLTSNEFLKRVSVGTGLVAYIKHHVGHKGPASALEVYIACLKRDPLYLYTAKPLQYYCLEFLRGILNPLLENAAQEFCPPKLLNGLCVSATPAEDINIYYANFHYSPPTKYDLKVSSFQSFFSSVNAIPIGKPGMTCHLKVSLPARLDHDFWNSDVLEDEGERFDWNCEGETTVLEVERWGYDPEVAKWQASCYAKNVIREIRVYLRGLPQPVSDYRPTSSDNLECGILENGNRLSRVWKFGSSNFMAGDIPCADGINSIQESALPSVLIAYYETFFLLESEMYSFTAEQLTQLLSDISSKTTDFESQRSYELMKIVGRRFMLVVRTLERGSWKLDTQCSWATEFLTWRQRALDGTLLRAY